MLIVPCVAGGISGRDLLFFLVAERWEQARITIPQATKFASAVISSFHVANEIIYSDSSPQSNF